MLATSNGVHGAPGLAAYGAAKGALIGLMRTLAVEGTEVGIKANAIAPWAVTRMVSTPAPSIASSRIPARRS